MAPDFPLEPSQHFLSFASSMGIVIQEDDTITQNARAFASITSRFPNDYFPFTRLKEHLYSSRFSSESDVKTAVENWLNGHNMVSAKPG
ncbi:hypothetical protein AVEN_220096-1 [Araneus ventricosus]|uniref:Uncharacterized protein n=1 Tax=Araneus ventricosus TaxID=182803 RepID=A0A4Y2J7G7_ARAVE|nr:hypothetical protein AVEN_220096-1 [Araneus ventricosus]